jgi:hypothetical protein
MGGKRNLLSMLLGVMMVALGVIAVGLMSSARAQDEPDDDMRMLFETLQKRVRDEDGFKFTVQFDHFIADYNSFQAAPDASEGSYLTLPFRSGNGEVNITLGKAGEDHVCFDEMRGQVRGARCFPYDEIANVAYPQ